MSYKKKLASIIVFSILTVIIVAISITRAFRKTPDEAFYPQQTDESQTETSSQSLFDENDLIGSQPSSPLQQPSGTTESSFAIPSLSTLPVPSQTEPVALNSKSESLISQSTETSPTQTKSTSPTTDINNTVSTINKSNVEDNNTQKTNAVVIGGGSASSVPDSTEEEAVEVMTFTSDDITSVLAKKMSDMDFPMSDISVKIENDSSFSVAGTCAKDELKKYIAENFKEYSSKADLFMLIMPNKLNVSINFSVSCNPESRLLSVAINSLVVNNISVPSNIVESVLNSKISDILNQAICDKNVYFTDIELENDKIVLYTKSL